MTDGGNDPFEDGPYDLVLNNADSITLPGGRYYFNSVVLNSSSTLSVAGPTVIYVTGTFELNSSGIVNPGQIPADLVVMVSSNLEVQLNSSVDFSGVIYAPNAHVVNNSSITYYGAIFGQEVTLNSSIAVHYDESLDDVDYLDGLQIATGSGGGASSTLVR